MKNINMGIYENTEGVFGKEISNFNDYFVPYMWGTLGILYNADVVTEEDLATSWGLLWNENNNPALVKKILMKDSIRDTYAAAVLYLKHKNELPNGYQDYSIADLINCTDKAMLVAAEAALIAQKSVIAGYEVDFGKDDLIEERNYVCLSWSGDAIYAIEEAAAVGVNLAYFVPEIEGVEASNVWFDGWVIPKTCKNTRAAQMFIDFLCRPEVAMANAMEILYTSAVDSAVLMESEEAIAILEDCEYDAEEFFTDTNIYPDPSSAGLGVMTDFGEDNENMVSMWERVKASTDGVSTLAIVAIILGALAAAIGIALLAVFIYEKNKGKLKKVS
jgi:spermidine/putrescine transport system substrate-binding protein